MRARSRNHRRTHRHRDLCRETRDRIDRTRNQAVLERAHVKALPVIAKQQFAIGVEMISLIVGQAIGQVELPGRYLRCSHRILWAMAACCTCD